MSSGGAEVIGEALKIPVVREITCVLMWFFGLQWAVNARAYLAVFILVLIGVGAAALFWSVYTRRKSSSGGGGGLKLLLVVVLMLALLPLLLVAASKRKRAAALGAGGG